MERCLRSEARVATSFYLRDTVEQHQVLKATIKFLDQRGSQPGFAARTLRAFVVGLLGQDEKSKPYSTVDAFLECLEDMFELMTGALSTPPGMLSPLAHRPVFSKRLQIAQGDSKRFSSSGNAMKTTSMTWFPLVSC